MTDNFLSLHYKENYIFPHSWAALQQQQQKMPSTEIKDCSRQLISQGIDFLQPKMR